MSKIVEKSREFVLPFLDKQYEKYGEHKQMELSRFDGYDMMTAYEEGYHQAEKDIALTVDDIRTIDRLLNKCVDCSNPYQEVLNRFNKLKEK